MLSAITNDTYNLHPSFNSLGRKIISCLTFKKENAIVSFPDISYHIDQTTKIIDTKLVVIDLSKSKIIDEYKEARERT